MTARPTPLRRPVLIGLLAAAVVTGAACGDPGSEAGPMPSEPPPDTTASIPTTLPEPAGPGETATDRPTTTTTPATVEADDVARFTIATLAPDDLVLRVGLEGSNGGDEPRLVTLYADGTVIVPDDDMPAGYESFRVDRAAVDKVLELAAAAQPYGDVDYGEVEVTDVGSTVVTVNTDRGSALVSVWALDMTDGVTAEQVAARRRLLALVGSLHTLHEHGSDPGPYLPAIIEIHLAPAAAEDHDAPTAPWPFDDVRREQWRVTPWLSACLPVPATELASLVDSGDEHVWTLSTTGTAAPPTVHALLRAVQPADEACNGAPAFEAPRPLTADDVRSTTSRAETPWPADARTTVHPLEAWTAESALITDVLPARLPDISGWDSTRWSWFDVGIVGVELGGERFVDVVATCTPFVEDDEPNCTILARIDAATGELVQFSAS